VSETAHPLIAIGICHLDGRRAGAKPVEWCAVDDTGQRPGQASALVVVVIIFAVFVGRRNDVGNRIVPVLKILNLLTWKAKVNPAITTQCHDPNNPVSRTFMRHL
jgi:hypothetical protein